MSPPDTTPRIFAYWRLPLEEAAVPGYRIERREQAERYAAAYLPDLIWGDLMEESARFRRRAFGSRPIAVGLLRQLEEGDQVLIPDSARAFRDWADLFQVAKILRARQVVLHLIDLGTHTGCAEGLARLQVLQNGVDAQAERRSEATALGMRRRKQPAEVNGSPPYPYRLVGGRGSRRRKVCEYTRGIGKQIVAWRDAGWTHTRIYFHMIREQIYTRDGREWSRTAIQRVEAAERAIQRQEAERPGVVVEAGTQTGGQGDAP